MSKNNSVSVSNNRDPFNKPSCSQVNNCLEVHFPKFFRDQGWANGMGAVQDAITLQLLKTDAPKKKVTFDFTDCRWIDPLPLLSSLIEITNACLLGMAVAIRLPASDDGPHPDELGPYQESPNRLLWFMDQEGFFDCLDHFKNSDGMINYPQRGGRNVYQYLRVKPSYEDSRCIPMTLLVVPKEEANPDFAQNSVEKILAGVDSKLEDKIEPLARERLIYKLRVALQEAIHNAQEHAYEKDAPTRLLAIYVRYRTGGLAQV